MRRSWVRIPLQALEPGGEGALAQSCLVCDELEGRVDLPGGFVAETELAVAFHVPPLPGRPEPYAGYLMVSPRRHGAAGFADLDDAEARDMGALMARASRALREQGAARVYSATIGHGVEHLHVHVVARWPETPEDVAWHRVDEWPGARRLDAAGVADLTGRLRRAAAL